MVYPDVYCNSKQRGFHLKNEFQIKFKEQKYKKKPNEHLGKDPSIYKNREEIFKFEQKPVNTADFTEEERKFAEKNENRKKRCKLAVTKTKKTI